MHLMLSTSWSMVLVLSQQYTLNVNVRTDSHLIYTSFSMPAQILFTFDKCRNLVYGA